MTVETLWKLQNLYLQEQILEQNINPSEGKELRFEKEEILAKQIKVNNQREDLEHKKPTLKYQEEKHAELEGKRKNVEEHLYSGQVQNPKELDSIQQKLQQLEQELQSCEEDYLLQLENVEQAAQDLQQVQQALKKQKQQYKVKVDMYLKEKQQVEADLAQIQQEIKAFEATIEPSLLALYRKKKRDLGPNVISLINGKTCSSCHMLIPALILKEAKLKSGLVNCESCGRILYWE